MPHTHYRHVTPEVVREIRRRFAAGAQRKCLAMDFHMSVWSVCRILNGLSWAHVEDIREPVSPGASAAAPQTDPPSGP